MLQYFKKDVRGAIDGYDFHIVGEMVINGYNVVIMSSGYFGDQYFTGPIVKAQCANTEFDDYDFVIIVGQEDNLLNDPLFMHEVGHLYMDGDKLLTAQFNTTEMSGMSVVNDISMEKRADSFSARFFGGKVLAAALKAYAAKILPQVADEQIRSSAEKALEERYAALA